MRTAGTRSRWFQLALATLLGLAGCGPSVHQVPMTDTEQRLANIVSAYLDAHGKLGHGPKDADELKPFSARRRNRQAPGGTADRP